MVREEHFDHSGRACIQAFLNVAGSLLRVKANSASRTEHVAYTLLRLTVSDTAADIDAECCVCGVLIER